MSNGHATRITFPLAMELGAFDGPDAEIAKHFDNPGAEIVGRCRVERPGDLFNAVDGVKIGVCRMIKLSAH